MKGKIYTFSEVNRVLPLLIPIVTDLVVAYRHLTTAIGLYEEARFRQSPDLDEKDAAVARALEKLLGFSSEVESLGGTIRDYERGGVDFYGDVAGQIVYFCWFLGEPSITKFHGVNEGFSSRRDVQPCHKVPS